MNNQTTENDTTGIVPKANTIEELREEAFEILKKLSHEQLMWLFPEMFRN